MTAPQEVVAEPRKRLPLLVGAGVALGLVLFLVTKMMGGGGDDETVAPSAATATTPTTAAAAAPATPAPAETVEVFTTKNPFLPLRTAATGGSAPAAASPAPAAVASPGGVVASPTGGTAAPAAGAAAGPQTTRVSLLDMVTEGNRLVANVRVNDTVSKVATGDTFATSFKVVSLDWPQRCGRFVFGDDQFRICKGEEIVK